MSFSKHVRNWNIGHPGIRVKSMAITWVITFGGQDSDCPKKSLHYGRFCSLLGDQVWFDNSSECHRNRWMCNDFIIPACRSYDSKSAARFYWQEMDGNNCAVVDTVSIRALMCHEIQYCTFSGCNCLLGASVWVISHLESGCYCFWMRFVFPPEGTTSLRMTMMDGTLGAAATTCKCRFPARRCFARQQGLKVSQAYPKKNNPRFLANNKHRLI